MKANLSFWEKKNSENALFKLSWLEYDVSNDGRMGWIPFPLSAFFDNDRERKDR